MSELKSLLAQKENLAEQLRRIAENCEGIENAENAAKVAALNEEQLKLSAQKADFQGKVATIDRELVTVGNKIQSLSGSGVEKILQAIKNQRWYFFKNKPKVLMDRDTALLWADLNYFPYLKNTPNGTRYHKNEAYPLVANLKFADFDKWRFPTYKEICFLVNDKTFSFMEGSNWQIKGNNWWFAMDEGFNTVDLNNKRQYNYDSSMCILPCNDVFVPEEYTNNISPQNNFYSETEKLQMTLNIFVQNDLIPLFDDEKITELYRQIYVEKPALQKKFAEVQQEIDKLNEVELISPTVDWLALKTKFDCGAEKSTVKYAESIKNLSQHLLEKFSDYAQEKSAVLDELQKLSPPNELVPNMDRVLADTEKFFDEATALKKSLLSVSNLSTLYALKNETRPPFDLVAEVLTEKVRQVLLQVEFFELQPEFVKSACVALNLKFEFEGEYLKQFRQHDKVTQKIILNLVRFVKAGHLQKRQQEDSPTLAEIVLEHLQNYRYAMAELYKNKSEEPSDAEITSLTERLQKNLDEVAEMVEDEHERQRLAGISFRLLTEFKF